MNLDKLYDLAENRLKAFGHSIPRRDLLKEAFAKTDFQTVVARSLNEAMSADDFPNVTANIQNKFLLPEYKYPITQTYEPFVLKRRVKDFKPIREVRTTEYANLQLIPGQFAEGMRFTAEGEEAINYTIGLYGTRTEHLWHLLVNDDLDAFSRKLGKLTRAAYRTKATQIYNIFNLNPNYDVDGIAVFTAGAWPAGHANTFNVALNAAGLATAQGALRSQTDTNGNRIIVSKYYLVVCSALEQVANQLWFQGGGGILGGATMVVDRTSATLPMMFAEMGMQKPIVSSFITGTTGWYLVADPNDVPFIEMGDIIGLENPVLLTSRGFWNEPILGFNLDQNFTTQNGCLISHGQDVVDPRGAVRGQA